VATEISVPVVGLTQRERATAKLTASKVVSPMRPPAAFFFHSDGKKWPSRVIGSSFSSEFGLSSIRRAHVIPGPRGALGESGGNKSAGNVDESSRAPGGPDLSARKAGRSPHGIVFRAL
jgi:hypothetical protein